MADRVPNLRRLDWDTDFWGFPVGQLDYDDESLSLPDSSELDQYIVTQTLTELNRANLSRKLGRAGFFPVDTRVSFGLDIESVEVDPYPATGLRIDEEGLAEQSMCVFAAVLSDNCRFVAYPVVENKITSFYVKWITNAENGLFDDGLMVARKGTIPVGLITFRSDNDVMSIGLLAVHPDYQGQSIGKSLVGCLVTRAREMALKTLSVVTEGSNIRAQRFYEKTGFLMKSMNLWMYRINE